MRNSRKLNHCIFNFISFPNRRRNRLFPLSSTLWVLLINFSYTMSKLINPEPCWINGNFQSCDNYDQSFFYGYGKDPTYSNALELAQSNLGSQIKVEIKAEMVSKIEESNFTVEQYEKRLIETRIEHNLPGIEIMGNYVYKGNNHIAIKLSKIKYFQKMKELREIASSTAFGLVKKADEQFNWDTFFSLQEAWIEIKDFLDVPIQVDYSFKDNNEYNLYTLIKLKWWDYLTRIQLKSITNEINAILGINENHTVSIKAFDSNTGNPIEGLPLVAEFGNNCYTKTPYSSQMGIYNFYFNLLIDKMPVQTFTIYLDNLKFEKNSTTIFNLNESRTISIPVNSSGPKIYIDSNCIELFERHESNMKVLPIIQQYFEINYMATFVDSKINSNLFICIELNTSCSPFNEIFNSFTEGVLTLKNSNTNEDVYHIKISQKGLSYTSCEHAIGGPFGSIREIEKNLKDKTLPEISKILGGCG